MLKGGIGSSELSTDYSIDTSNTGETSENNTLVSAGGGLVFESPFVVGAEYSKMFTNSLFGRTDRYHLEQIKLYGGYRIKFAPHFRITPMLGTTWWKLESKSGEWFTVENPRTGVYQGNTIYGQLNLEFPINHWVTVITSINRTKYDFGTTKSIQAGAMFQF